MFKHKIFGSMTHSLVMLVRSTYLEDLVIRFYCTSGLLVTVRNVPKELAPHCDSSKCTERLID